MKMRRSIVGKGIKISLGIMLWGGVLAITSHAGSDIKLWKNQTVYVPIYSHIFLGGNERFSLNFAVNLIVRNTDPDNSIQVTEVRYYNSFRIEGNGRLFIRQQGMGYKRRK